MLNDSQAKQVNFDQARPPALSSGDYTLSVTQTMVVTTPADLVHNVPETTHQETYENTHRIAVLGPRSTLPNAQIVARFPPINGAGDYDQVFPHLVFAQDSLPWQRSLTLGQKSGWTAGDTPPAPWFALLLFDASDAPVSRMGTLAEVIRVPGDASVLPNTTISYGDQLGWVTEWGQSPSDPCALIDVPRTTFLALAPSSEDLPWLAHTREVSLIAPGLHDRAGEAPGSYAVVCSNRMALKGQRYQAILVSLEGLSHLLPLDGDTPSFDAAAWTLPSSGGVPCDHLRLFALSSWSFSVEAPTQTFTGYLTHLQPMPLANKVVNAKPPSALRASSVPFDNAVAQTTMNTAQDALTLAYEGGYSLLPHHTRTGETTASWYRGPLLPFVPSRMAQPDAMSEGPDSLVGYDPDQGLMDMSLATAWQTGQMLALQDTTLAKALLAWRTDRAQATMRARWGEALIRSFAPEQASYAAQPFPSSEDIFHEAIEHALQNAFTVLTRSAP